MLLGLYAAHRANPKRWLAYSRNKSDYGPSQLYVHPEATAKAVTVAADFLARTGFVDHRRGSYDRSPNPFGGPGGKGYRSRLRARPALVELMEGMFSLSPTQLRPADWIALVRLKAAPEVPRGPKRLLRYPATDETRKMVEQLSALNAFLAGFDISLEPGMESIDTADGQDEENREERVDPADRSASYLYRVFNNGRWDHGGRFYGGWWQALGKQDRRRLLIDGEETVELDFRALHPRLCYHLEGQPLPDDVDPYVLPGLEGEERRAVIKRAFNQLLNIANDRNPRAPGGALAALPRRMSYRALLEHIVAAHGPIRSWFRGGRGMELQRIDSEIASAVLTYLRHRGICCLPVHDSFIVPRSAEFVLGQTMALAYHGALGWRSRARAYPVITGWSSPEMERRVTASLLAAPSISRSTAPRP